MSSMLLPAWDGTVAESFSGGDGTENNPFRIENGSQLAYFSNLVNGKNTNLPNGVPDKTFSGVYVLIANSINLGNREFTPIGFNENEEALVLGEKQGFKDKENWSRINYFKGKLDGNNKVITGLKITKPEKECIGLFGVLESGGEIKDLCIYEGQLIGLNCVGGIVGASRGDIINCSNSAKIIGQSNEGTYSGLFAGGIVGIISNGTIQGCKNYGRVLINKGNNNNAKPNDAGGVVGCVAYLKETEEVNIYNCENNGEVKSDYQVAGGIVGEFAAKKATISECKNTGTVTSTDYFAGGIAGVQASGGTVINCNNSGTITGNRGATGGISGRINGDGEEINNCSNSGLVSGYMASGGIGGLQEGESYILNCNNSGHIAVTTQQVGGIVGKQRTIICRIKDKKLLQHRKYRRYWKGISFNSRRYCRMAKTWYNRRCI